MIAAGFGFGTQTKANGRVLRSLRPIEYNCRCKQTKANARSMGDPMTAALTVDRRPEPARAAMRLVPVPRSEPPTDDELGEAGLQAPSPSAVPLPLDLATGAQVRRNRRSAARQAFDRRRWDGERVSGGPGPAGSGVPGGSGAAGA